ncbi:hypothetical protein RFI_26790 [Reticulomyxa filosa]|uniref:Uncharacterized protein n=1 Tax=Reticulomyxa filosa TaxID=46433 RepID=X6MAU1_RETFI|nr:hypothetical protein RFI_26790 [Reticulomyxa filosa]|eukprot:ETO10587.1 hypothetical protein RFI_26790 [Reticulomyxa filosa]
MNIVMDLLIIQGTPKVKGNVCVFRVVLAQQRNHSCNRYAEEDTNQEVQQMKWLMLGWTSLLRIKNTTNLKNGIPIFEKLSLVVKIIINLIIRQIQKQYYVIIREMTSLEDEKKTPSTAFNEIQPLKLRKAYLEREEHRRTLESLEKAQDGAAAAKEIYDYILRNEEPLKDPNNPYIHEPNKCVLLQSENFQATCDRGCNITKMRLFVYFLFFLCMINFVVDRNKWRRVGTSVTNIETVTIITKKENHPKWNGYASINYKPSFNFLPPILNMAYSEKSKYCKKGGEHFWE